MKPLYENNLIYLTPFNESFAVEGSPYLGWFHDADVTKYNSHGLFPYGKKALQAFLDSLNDGDKTVFAIIAKKHPDGKHEPWGGIHIGNCTLQRINWVSRSAEFAIVIGDKDYWNKGIGTMALEFMLEHGFDKMNMHRIWTGTVDKNTGMRRSAEKAGMKYEGAFRQASFLSGKYRNIVVYGILDMEWVALRTFHKQGTKVTKEWLDKEMESRTKDQIQPNSKESLPHSMSFTPEPTAKSVHINEEHLNPPRWIMGEPALLGDIVEIGYDGQLYLATKEEDNGRQDRHE